MTIPDGQGVDDRRQLEVHLVRFRTDGGYKRLSDRVPEDLLQEVLLFGEGVFGLDGLLGLFFAEFLPFVDFLFFECQRHGSERIHCSPAINGSERVREGGVTIVVGGEYCRDAVADEVKGSCR